MLTLLADLDTALFRFINITLANSLTDRVMPFVTNGEHWILAVALAACLLIHFRRRESLIILAGVAIVFAACDQASAHLFKPWVERVRPCHAVVDVHLLATCSGAYSFPSAHATNSFGCAVFLSWALPRWRWAYFALSALVSVSRVFVGVHYPGDLLGGVALGTLIAGAVVYGFGKIPGGRRGGVLARPAMGRRHD